MALDDVWRDIGSRLHIHWKGRFDYVPFKPGIYAWFYPLRLTSYSLDDFVAELNTVLAFDARSGGTAERALSTEIGWETIGVQVTKDPLSPDFSKRLRDVWGAIIADDEKYHAFRRDLMRASLFMPR
jgi:hypothetical protein